MSPSRGRGRDGAGDGRSGRGAQGGNVAVAGDAAPRRCGKWKTGIASCWEGDIDAVFQAVAPIRLAMMAATPQPRRPLRSSAFMSLVSAQPRRDMAILRVDADNDRPAGRAAVLNEVRSRRAAVPRMNAEHAASSQASNLGAGAMPPRAWKTGAGVAARMAFTAAPIADWPAKAPLGRRRGGG